jgi:peptidoglycan/LPS O-acetylase OafA/YrhL
MIKIRLVSRIFCFVLYKFVFKNSKTNEKNHHLPRHKKHYEILDALQGFAAILVVVFHLFEIFSGGDHAKQIINHGYLAVDFFFALSGFVIGYAYDDRWQKMGLKDFFKRRLIRLHPMIIMGMLIGAVAYYYSYSPILFPQIKDTPLWKLIVVTLIGCTLVPLSKSFEIRGWGEMHPLNGPAWSLYYEYIANIFYALTLRKLPTKILMILGVIAAVFTVNLAVFGANGDVIGGWSLNIAQTKVGFARLSYPFIAGLVVSRIYKPIYIKNAFLWCTVLILFFLSVPRIGTENWQNGIYESLVIIIAFPLIVYLGASGEIKGKLTKRISQFLGDISYPIYIIHYPFIYIFSSYVVDNKLSMVQAIPSGLLVIFTSIAVAYLSLKLYDIPIRKWLTKKFI